MKYMKGKTVKGIVTGIESYGAFVAFDEFYTGLIHISEISSNFVPDINKYLKIGDPIYVKILEVDEDEAHLKLSIKNIQYKVNGKAKKRKIIETPKAFSTLSHYLPIWTAEKLKSIKKGENAIDK